MEKPARGSDDRSIELPDEAHEQIPTEIMSFISEICDQEQVQFKSLDYKRSLQRAREETIAKGGAYYEDAPVEDILKFASVGTDIALRILEVVERGDRPWTSGRDLAGHIVSSLKKGLGEGYTWLRQGFHFVCNPLLLPWPIENHMWKTLQSRISSPIADLALDRLYRN